MAFLDQDDPITADANAFGQGRLIQFELLAPVTDDGAKIGWCANKHVILNVNDR